ncbi:Protein XRP2 [Hypsibius exemplaris]|uniref:Protein XRP2 n=1 Tax=Hypsibius exemplaris TaxID=2072580 RepID=A0A1W0W936_HYPEX|nr:Protein XRP2 [Hypsibius exemplaris]
MQGSVVVRHEDMGQVMALVRSLFVTELPRTEVATISAEADMLKRRRLSSSGNISLKTYSWSNRAPVNPGDYSYVDVENKTLTKSPGTINGHQFIIERCRNSNIFLFDWTDSVTVLDCTGCAIFVGPCKGSIFLRHCVDCTILVLSQQFRTRDCRRIAAYICCATQPIIENTVGAKFACLQVNYPELEDQMKSAGLSAFNNNWSHVHDFTPNSEGLGTSHNYLLVGDNLATAKVGLNEPETIGELDLAANFDPTGSFIPHTVGLSQTKVFGETSAVLIFTVNKSNNLARSFVKTMQSEHPGLVLVSTKEIAVSPGDLQRILRTNAFAVQCAQGPVVVLNYQGLNAVTVCKKLSTAPEFATQSVVSDTEQSAHSTLDSLSDLAEMKMN